MKTLSLLALPLTFFLGAGGLNLLHRWLEGPGGFAKPRYDSWWGFPLMFTGLATFALGAASLFVVTVSWVVS
jgi:hypothetical protein